MFFLLCDHTHNLYFRLVLFQPFLADGLHRLCGVVDGKGVTGARGNLLNCECSVGIERDYLEAGIHVAGGHEISETEWPVPTVLARRTAQAHIWRIDSA